MGVRSVGRSGRMGNGRLVRRLGRSLDRPTRVGTLELAFGLGSRQRIHGRVRLGPTLPLPARARAGLGLLGLLHGFPRSLLVRRLGWEHVWKRTWGAGVEQGGASVAEAVGVATLVLGDLVAALPRLKFPALVLLCLLGAAVLRERLVVVKGNVQVQVEVVPDGLPHTSPRLLIHLSVASRTTLLCARPALGGVMAHSRRGRWLGVGIKSTGGGAVLAEPGSGRHGVQADAVRVRGHVTTVTQQEDVLVVVILAVGARGHVKVLLEDVVSHDGRVDVGHLDAVFDGVGGHDVTWTNGNLASRLSAAASNSPPARVLNSTQLNFWRQMGQLLARSTQGFRHSSWRYLPHGRRWAIM